jgi:arylsulfatase A-like enzyme/predicted Zn-dependent protease
MAETLRAAGYATAAVVGAYVLHGQYGLDRGFDHYDDRFRQPRGEEDQPQERSAEVVTDRALAWLEAREDDRPFLLWAHFYDPHAPYAPPGSYRLRFATRPYDGEIAYTDEHVGRLLAGLGERGLRERTVVVLTADHGEAFGDGGEKTHGLLLRRSTLHVPLVISAPGVIAPRRVAGVVSGADILPTVLALTGIDGPGDPDGVSLLPALAEGRSRGRTAYSETRLPADMYGWSMLAGVRNDERAYVRGPIPELYDLTVDPTEQDNLHAERPEESRDLDAGVGAVLAREREAAPAKISDEEVQALRALGYVADSEIAKPTGADPKERIDAWNRVNDLRVYLAEGRYPELIAALEEVLEADPGNREARVLLGQGLVGAGRAEEGIVQFQALAEGGWFLGRSGILFARTLAESGHPREAERLLRDFEEREPKFADHPFNLGVLLQSQGRTDEACEAFERALRLNPEGVHILANLAAAIASTRGRDPGTAARALDLIDQAIRFSMTSDRPRLLKVDILRRLGRLDEARAEAAELAVAPSYRDITAADVADAIRAVQEDAAAAR